MPEQFYGTALTLVNWALNRPQTTLVDVSVTRDRHRMGGLVAKLLRRNIARDFDAFLERVKNGLTLPGDGETAYATLVASQRLRLQAARKGEESAIRYSADVSEDEAAEVECTLREQGFAEVLVADVLKMYRHIRREAFAKVNRGKK